MEEELNNLPESKPEEVVDTSLCVNCKKNKFEDGYATKICSECREQFIKYPIPKWIWGFAIGVIVVMIIGMFRMPKYFGAAYHLSKAEKAIENRAYITAQKELLKIIDEVPDNVEVNGNLLIAAAHNNNYALAGFAYQKLEGKEIKDNDFFLSIQSAMTLVESNFPIDTTLFYKIKLAEDSVEDLKQIYNILAVKDNVDQNIAGVYVADRLYDMELYSEAEEILNKVLLKNTDFYPAISLMAAVKRNSGKYDHAIAFCDQLLVLNSEDVNAYGQKAKIELKRKDDSMAGIYISKALAIDSTDTYALEALALLNLYTNKKSESLKIFNTIQQSEMGGDTTITCRLRKYINGIKNYR
jgi:tetratricopeptide (TPR) repeat protein